MVQAKGVLPRDEDRAVLLRNPRACGYFVGVHLGAAMSRTAVIEWLCHVDAMVTELVVREAPVAADAKGEKTSTVAVGFAPAFFGLSADPAEPSEVPASFSSDNPLPPVGAPQLDVHIMFYVVSVFEARVNTFVSRLAEVGAGAHTITLERGYQRLDGTEPFGYQDGVRNALPKSDRTRFIFVHRDGLELDEPAWADGGTYMAYVKIRQHPAAFAQLLDDAARDQIIGRAKDGTRLDLVGRGIKPHEESADVPEGLPPASHVRKTGPRGAHDDVQIYRRGLPYLETTSTGELAIGLQFCSFQASLDQFDVIFNDWSLNTQFPPPQGGAAGGTDALLDPAHGLVSLEKHGYFFVPPYNENGLAAALFPKQKKRQPKKTGRLVVRKRITSPAEPNRRFERHGFVFQVLDGNGQPVGGPFTTDSTGRAACPVQLEIGQPYTLREVATPIPGLPLVDTAFTPAKSHDAVVIVNQVQQPGGPYGGIA